MYILFSFIVLHSSLTMMIPHPNLISQHVTDDNSDDDGSDDDGSDSDDDDSRSS